MKKILTLFYDVDETTCNYVKKRSTLWIPNWGGVGSRQPTCVLFSKLVVFVKISFNLKAEIHKVSVSTFPLTPANIDSRLSEFSALCG